MGLGFGWTSGGRGGDWVLEPPAALTSRGVEPRGAWEVVFLLLQLIHSGPSKLGAAPGRGSAASPSPTPW